MAIAKLKEGASRFIPETRRDKLTNKLIRQANLLIGENLNEKTFFNALGEEKEFPGIDRGVLDYSGVFWIDKESDRNAGLVLFADIHHIKKEGYHLVADIMKVSDDGERMHFSSKLRCEINLHDSKVLKWREDRGKLQTKKMPIRHFNRFLEATDKAEGVLKARFTIAGGGSSYGYPQYLGY